MAIPDSIASVTKGKAKEMTLVVGISTILAMVAGVVLCFIYA